MSIAINLPFRRTQIFAFSLAFLLLAASCSSSESSNPALPASTTSAAEAATSTAEPEPPSPPSTVGTVVSTAAESQPSTATYIAANYSSSCAISQDKTVFCWGSNIGGQLGVGQFYEDLAYSPIPLQVKEITDAAALAMGSGHTCALHQDGTISCWGGNGAGQAGQLGADQYGSDIAIPEKVPGITDAVAVAAGRWHTCALRRTGTVSCWGGNSAGQLGKSQTLQDIDDPTELVQVSNITDATAIAAGQNHTCALHQNGIISCWGSNEFGQLGSRHEDLVYSPTPVQVKNIDDATAIDVGLYRSCALRQDGTISCWGSNSSSRLDTNPTLNEIDDPAEPVQVNNITDAAAITIGENYYNRHSCALHQNGTISCWGSNGDGQLGNGQEDLFYSPTPVQVKNIADITAIAAGYSHSCALRKDGAIFCWGNNGSGQLGDGSGGVYGDESLVPVRVGDLSISASPATSAAEPATSTAEPEPASPPSTTLPSGEAQPNFATSISASYSHSCAVSDEGKVFCWGDNDHGKLGIGKSEIELEYSAVPLEVEGIADAAAVATGENHTCALHQSGTVSCWGSDRDDQIGIPDSAASVVPVQIEGIKDAVWIATGNGHTCAVHQDGTISCWGYNRVGALGNRQAYEGENLSTPTPVRVEGITDATAVTASSSYTCALHRAGTISCWGNNSDGQLGSGQTGEELEESAVPVQVADITDAIAIASSQWHSCALHRAGTISCWGNNWRAPLGNGQNSEELEESAVPVQVADITDAIAIATGKRHSCALREDGTIACWGGDEGFGLFGETSEFQDTGQLGTFPVPVQVTDITDAVAIATGEDYSCALHQNGEISCWGYNLWGRLGNGQSGAEESDTPVEVAGISNAKDIAAGRFATCVLLESGSISCWGHGNLGQPNTSAEVVEIDGISNAIDIAAGWFHSCALHKTGTISCWGYNWSGLLGNGRTSEELEYFDPVEVEGITDAVAVTAGPSHSCALHENGTISCWGDNDDGQLGDGTGGEFGDESLVPVRVNGISDATAVATSWSHSCALHENGTISCWGENYDGRLGNGTDENSSVPVQVSFITDATAISLGPFFSCAVRENGTVACWGGNNYWQLGTWRQPDTESLPGVVPGITDAVSIASGYSGSCALREDGTIACWRLHPYGEPVIDEVKAIAIGGLDQFAYYCAIRENGKVYCWSNNHYGQLGNEAIWSAVPAKVVGFGG